MKLFKKKQEEIRTVTGKKNLQILGSGCAKCNKLEENTIEAAKALGASFEISHIKEISEILSMGVMSTPALAIDGKVVSSGKLLSVNEIKEILLNN